MTYTSDNSGRIQSKSDVGSYDYGIYEPHAVEGLGIIGPYMMDGKSHEIEYTSFEKIKQIVDSDTLKGIFYYSIDNSRYMYEFYEQEEEKYAIAYSHGNYEVIKEEGQSNTRQLHYINSPSGLIAIQVKNNSQDTLYFIHSDYLGSYNVISNNTNDSIEELSFDPWGRRRDPTTWSYTGAPTSTLFRRGFTGHEHLDDFKLINMNGRMYDPLEDNYEDEDFPWYR
jgi:hypothetical protein